MNGRRTNAAMWAVVLCVLLGCTGVVWAHKASDSYLSLQQEGTRFIGQWDIHLRDLDFVLGLDRNEDRRITWGEVQQQTDAIGAYALSHLALSGPDAAPCPLSFQSLLTDQHTDGGYAVINFVATCVSAPQALGIEYHLLFDVDTQHRGLLSLARGEIHTAGVFGPETHHQVLQLSSSTRGAQFKAYLHNGIEHIFTGFDHQLFLLCLLLPCVYRRQHDRWQAVSRFGPAFVDVVKVVTAFTVAHSLTLSLAVFGYVSLPSRWVESAIAFTVIVAAANNLWPLVQDRRWSLALGFGLVHGLGFASVLTDLGLVKETLALTLVAFNLGVEVGQLAIVAAFLPCAYVLRLSRFYRYGVLQLGSVAIIVVATAWLLERGFDISLWRVLS